MSKAVDINYSFDREKKIFIYSKTDENLKGYGFEYDNVNRIWKLYDFTKAKQFIIDSKSDSYYQTIIMMSSNAMEPPKNLFPE